VEHIIKNTLGERLKECKKPKDIEEIKVLDPACGSGSFLIDAFDEINDFNNEKSWNEQATIDANSTRGFVTAKDRILKQNIYGVDLDPKAVEIAQLNLLLKTSETKHRLPILKENIKVGDSLIQNPEITKHSFIWKDEFEKIMSKGGFDTVIGNPPWVSFGLRNVGKLDKKESEYYRTNYKSAEYKLSTYALFIERGIGLLKENGYFAFILPDSFLLGRYFSKLRRYILDTCKIQEILITFYDVFSGKATTGRNVILVLKKTKDRTKRINNKVKIIKVNTLKEFQNKKFETFGYNQEYFENLIYNRFRLFFNKEDKDFIEKTEQNSNPLSNYMVGHTGVRSLSGQKNVIGKSQKSKTWKKGLISGSQIGKYWLEYQGDFINIEPKLLNKGGWDSEVILNDKIMIRQTGDRIYATIDKDKYYHLNNIHSFNFKNNKLSMTYVLALLNSKLMSAYYLLTTLEKSRVMAQTDIETLEKLPIKEISEAQQKPFIELVEQLIVLNKQLKEVENKETSKKQEIKSEIEKKEKKLDNLVYQLYGVEESQNLIEKALN
jgi:type I restriction-modification system DNA methylase subunit